MIQNYLIIAIRNIWKRKVFNAINVVGLAIGISAALVIYLLVQYDAKFEQFHPDKDRLYRMVSHISFTDLEIDNSGVPFPTATAVRNDLPQVELATQFLLANEQSIRIPVAGSDPITIKKQKDIVYADSMYFSLFSYQWLAGSKEKNLKQPFQTVLTESRAALYFPGIPYHQLIGKEIIYSDSIRCSISGIVKELNPYTDLTFKEFISLPTIFVTDLKRQYSTEQWGSINSSSQLFLKLAKNELPQKVEKQLVLLRDKYRNNLKEEPKDAITQLLQPITSIHYNTQFEAYGNRKANRKQEAGLLAIAGFLLVLGAINYINLSTAQASDRAKEIGIRKTLGSNKFQIQKQFLAETFLITLSAALLSILLTPWLLESFDEFIPKSLSVLELLQPHVLLFLGLMVLALSFLAGYYPAILLSRLQPVAVLKQTIKFSGGHAGKAWLRKSLTIAQFGIACFFLLATFIVGKQIYFSLNKELGFKKEAIVHFSLPWDFFSDKEDNRRFILQQELSQLPGIVKVSLANDAPASGSTSTTDMDFLVNGAKKTTMIEVKRADSAYFDLYGMQLVAGRTLRNNDTTREYVINQTFAKLLGFDDPKQAIGILLNQSNPKPVVGVLKDFHPRSTHESIKPLAYSSELKYCYSLHLALANGKGQSANWPATLKQVEKAYSSIYPEEEFSYKFFDESVAELYKTEQHTLSLLKWAAGLCIFISALGLLGLVIYATNSRTKEIGIRKVLGASIANLVYLLSKDFLKLVFIALLIASPLTVFVMNKWLEEYAYRTEISWWLFALTGGILLLLSLVTISFRTIKAAKENPINNLRSE
ncbi:ABC transporter permease [Flavihumibacter sp. CACIAM 22H1]|uniref:ABC transporter permease n=1 Tax=Flavihumibacter sp. CACIAM 22H1 TaxID=1812911 RepID=UPI0007A8D3B1|nr:ABC transporter permease [Flavihumibacter sp. CACIAM 22H1]KYP14487.1 MAG: hypothetical protein A1D16_21215 [Flavihumibacter sp. CACIAM 22H1]